MFSIMDIELRPYEVIADDHAHLEWRAPLTPKKFRKVKKVNRLSKLRNIRRSSEDDRSEFNGAVKRNCSATHTRRDRVPQSLVDYEFIRRDDDYEPFIQEIWHDQITRGWPKAIPITTVEGINVAVRQCVKFISADDSAYYILLCGGIIGFTSARHDGVNLRTLPRLFHKIRIRAVRALRNDVSELGEGRPSDSLMAGILSFALQETVYDNDLTESPLWPKSPLARAQLLGWVGGLHRNSHHLEAFYELLERRGGLQTVTEPGLRRMIYLCDLLTSSIIAASPRYPLYGSTRSLFASGRVEMDDEASTLSDAFAVRFKTFSPLSWQFLEPILDLLPDIRDATLAVDMHQRTKGKKPQLGELVDFANSVHWRILSLCHQRNQETKEFSEDTLGKRAESIPLTEDAMMNIITKQTLEPIRLATLIYSNLVIFPVSFSAGVASHLASSLRDLYESRQIRIFEPELELWVLAMGCLASWGTNDRGWYLIKVKNLMNDLCYPEVMNKDGLKCPSRSIFLDIMSGFLWWDHVCSVPMREIWEEMYGTG